MTNEIIAVLGRIHSKQRTGSSVLEQVRYDIEISSRSLYATSGACVQPKMSEERTHQRSVVGSTSATDDGVKGSVYSEIGRKLAVEVETKR
ncbi:hypothetical protein Hypma_009898 [Hypsizygus marmoreus]|uniref:Uncharacterized protein n=1 Tax=Hypsizygus marmoreus TaxID=39966 RepID=A0A369JMK8_HYPMA|nr:hypothetical protein Hypma_009898 [Hypsizygus marmoreus]